MNSEKFTIEQLAEELIVADDLVKQRAQFSQEEREKHSRRKSQALLGISRLIRENAVDKLRLEFEFPEACAIIQAVQERMKEDDLM